MSSSRINIFQNLPIGSKLGLLLIVPVIGFIYGSYQEISDKLSVANEMKTIEPIIDLAIHASALVHELQKERGLSAGYIGSSGTRFVEKLQDQRQLVDQRISELKEHLSEFDYSSYGKATEGSITESVNLLSGINYLRSTVTDLTTNIGIAVSSYSTINELLLKITERIPHLSQNGEISALASAYLNFAQAKERSGIERAVLSNTFAADTFQPGMLEAFISLVATQDTYTDVFLGFASPEQQQFYNDKMSAQAVDDVEEFREIASANSASGEFGVDPSVWFSTITKKINLLKEIEDKLGTDLQNRVHQLVKDSNNMLILVATISITILTVVLFLALMISRSIRDEIYSFRDTIKDIETNSDLTLLTNISSRDEIGDTSRAFDNMLVKFRLIITNVFEASLQLSSNTQQMMIVTEQTKKGALRQSSETDQIATAITQMSATVQEVAKSAANAAEAAHHADEETRAGREVVSQTITAIEKQAHDVEQAAEVIHAVEEHSEKIGTVVDVIRGIAEQTNLLALNAAIEAARAGEQGRGFAVVADEVRTLSQRTQDSTSEIREMIEKLQEKAQNAVHVMDEGKAQMHETVTQATLAGTSLETIANAVATINSMNAQIACASDEQSAVADEISRNVHTIMEVNEKTTDGAQQTASNTEELSQLAKQLNDMINQFKV